MDPSFAPLSHYGPLYVLWVFFNIWAFGAAAIAIVALRGAWYHPSLFGGIWTRLHAQSESSTRGRYGLPFAILTALLLAGSLALGAATLDLAWLMAQGPNYKPEPLDMPIRTLLTVLGAFGFGGVVTSINAMHHGFAQKSFKLVLIDAGYLFVALLIAALIVGFWSITPNPNLFAPL